MPELLARLGLTYGQGMWAGFCIGVGAFLAFLTGCFAWLLYQEGEPKKHMSGWNHNICDGCWKDKRGEAVPIRLKEPETELCCFCGSLNTGGIYVRANPQDMGCTHDEKKDVQN